MDNYPTYPICPNRINVTPVFQKEPEYACGCPQGEGCNMEYLPPLLCEELLAEYRKREPDWDIHMNDNEVLSILDETPNKQKRRRSRAKKQTEKVIQTIQTGEIK